MGLEDIEAQGNVAQCPLHGQAEKRLRVLEASASLRDLARLPGNRLEALSGDRQGQYGIRINQQWRICFEWRAGAEPLFRLFGWPQRPQAPRITTSPGRAYFGVSSLSFSRMLLMSRFPCNTRTTRTPPS